MGMPCELLFKKCQHEKDVDILQLTYHERHGQLFIIPLCKRRGKGHFGSAFR